MEGRLLFGSPSSGDPSVFLDCGISASDSDEEILVDWNGRLDNRSEVRSLAGGTSDDSTADLVGRLFRRLGDQTFETLIGDFALAVWDASRRRILLARDPFGTRPLYYARTADRWLWSPRIDSLQNAEPSLGDELDDDWIAGFLSTGLPRDHTVYSAIRIVPPGHVLTLEPNSSSPTCRRFWRPEDLPDTRLASDLEYEARFLELLTEAVACRLDTPGTVFAELSGGLDSSSIVCIADRLIRQGRVPANELETLSYVFDRAKTSDERRWILPVERQVRRPALHVCDSDAPFLEGFEHTTADLPTIMTGFAPRLRRTAERMHEVGARRILSGVAGDQVASGDFPIPPQLGDLAAAHRWRELFRELASWRNHHHNPYSVLLARGVLHNLLPNGVRHRLQRRPDLLPWVSDRFARRHDIFARYEGATQAADARFRLPSQRTRFEVIQHVTHGAVPAIGNDLATLGLEAAYPFLDRRLVEFCLSIPSGQFCRPGESRSLARRALRGVLPEEIRTRTDKQGPDEAMLRAFVQQWPRIEEMFSGDAEVYRRGYVDRERLMDAFMLRRAGDATSNRVEMVIYLEVWLRRHAQQTERTVERTAERGTARQETTPAVETHLAA